MSYCSSLYSHHNKILEKHLLKVANNSKNIFNELCIKNKNLYTNLSFFIGISHDFAKSTTYFQEKLFKGIRTENANHGFLSAVFGYYVVKNYLTINNLDYQYDFPTIAFILILRHHGNLLSVEGLNGIINKLDNYNRIALNQIIDIKNNLNNPKKSLKHFYNDYDILLEDFLENYSDLLDEIEDALEDISFDENIGNYFYIILFYSVLLDSDKMDASETNNITREIIPNDIVDIFKSENFSSSYEGINKIREDAYLEVTNNMLDEDLNNRIFSIDLPTGAGKTLTAFSSVLKLREKINEEYNFNPRIIYSLPFLSIIDQNEKVFSEILEYSDLRGTNILLKHNYFSDMSYKVDSKYDLPMDKSRILIEGWNSEIIVTTFIQFFYSLISNKNRSLRKFHNMINSIIILDEIQSVPYPYWKIINVMLSKLAYEFNSWVILMTATQPLIFSKDEIIPLVQNKNCYYDTFDRYDYSFNLNDLNFEDFKKVIIAEIQNNSKSMMVVLNTVNSSKELYNYIKSYFEESSYDMGIDENGICCIDDDIQLTYMSTNIISKHRLNKINKIKESNKRNIIITTQLVEAGVDISVDIIFRDLAPLDAIIQTAGRCNRNGNGERGIVNIISLINDKGKRFSSFVYDSILIKSTRDVIKDLNLISEREFNLFASDEYYKNLLKYRSSANSEELIEILERLDFKEIQYKFKLIDNDIEKTDVFIEIDEDASELWNRFEENRLILNSFERTNDFLSFKADFYENIVSVNTSKLGTIVPQEQWLGFVSNDDLYRKYDLETGFIYSDNEDAFII
ncbi:CRISPR-associated helicase, Cas3 family [Methanobrevibacter olleyae]|uniref:CRISPR-associated helicase, Cas3 family n=1 Tax=Methanobrevibacter olleyae TaxID=294671 RepID=A0A1I4K6V8_METOL|nr:CRISPR-associated helicase/endonuclease Cas3 [Methanobrevibacter olleyae]SFL74542.1 CRISPR-associated helicase, Cas3 family [Methanobrevibacter olleyae]